jgi:hypothetical protein
MKIRPVAVELLHADRHDEAINLVSQFRERAQKHQYYHKIGLNAAAAFH